MSSPGNLKLHSFDLGDEDRACLTRIRQRLELSSNALAVRLALRSLAARLNDEHPPGGAKNGRPDAVTPDLPEQQKSLAGTSAVLILLDSTRTQRAE